MGRPLTTAECADRCAADLVRLCEFTASGIGDFEHNAHPKVQRLALESLLVSLFSRWRLSPDAGETPALRIAPGPIEIADPQDKHRTFPTNPAHLAATPLAQQLLLSFRVKRLTDPPVVPDAIVASAPEPPAEVCKGRVIIASDE